MQAPVQDAPLLPFIHQIMARKGYVTLVPKSLTGTQHFMKPLGSGSLSGTFYVVSGRDVQKMGVLPAEKPVSHAAFIAANVRHLFAPVI